MVVTPVPFTSSKKEADHMKMPYRVVYTWKYLPTGGTGGAFVWVWDKNDAQILMDYWNRPSSSKDTWEYTLIRVEKVR